MNNMISYVSSEFSYALGWTFLHSLWQACLLMILLLIFQRVFKLKSTGKYWSTLCVMAMLLLVSVFTFFQYFNISEPISQLANSSFFVISDTILQNTQPLNSIEQFLPIVAWVWIVGAVFYAIRLIGGFVQIHQLKTSGILISCKEWKLRLDKLLTKTQVKKTVQLLESTRIDAPMVLGYFKPIILLPVGMISGLSTDQVEAIILHELSHIKRNDFVINVLQSIIEVIFYYHPVVWWFSAQIRKEREHCCDDQILAYGVDKFTYARALTNARTTNFNQNKLTMGLANNKNDLLNRIKRMVEGKDQPTTNFYTKGIPLIILIAVLTSFTWYQGEKIPKEIKPPMAMIPPPPLMLDFLPEIVESVDTIIVDEVKPEIYESHSKTIITWTDENGETHEIIKESDEAPENPWDSFIDYSDSIDLDHDFGFSIDLQDISPHFEALSRVDFDFNQNFDFPLDFDTIPEFQREHLMRIEEELARSKEMMEKLHHDFKWDSEDLSDEEKEKLHLEMQTMQEEMLSQFERLNEFHYRDRIERNRSELKDRVKELKEREEYAERNQFYKEREAFSTQQLEEKMRHVDQELAQKKEEIKVLKKNFELYQKELIKQLKKDNHLKKGEELNNFEMTDDRIIINGKSVEVKDRDKYHKLRKKYLE